MKIRPLDPPTEVQPLEYSKVQPLELSEVQPLEYSKVQPLEYSKVQPLEYSKVHPLEYSKVQPLELSEVHPLEYSKVQPLELSIDFSYLNSLSSRVSEPACFGAAPAAAPAPASEDIAFQIFEVLKYV